MTEQRQILVVDDKEETRDLLQQLLEDRYRVTLSVGAREAIASIQRDRPDLVILDLMMPEVDGFEVRGYLRGHAQPFLPVIVRSAAQGREVRLKALKMGAQEFLGTPFDEEELSVRVHSMLALKEAREVAEQRARDLEAAVEVRTRELRLALEDLRQSNRYKDEFLGVMSHELRTPLGTIVAYASSLEDGVVGLLSAEQLDMVRQVLLGAERMTVLVSNLLDMSLIATGKFRLTPQSHCFAPLVEQALASLRPLAAQKGVALSTELQVPEPVLLDDQRTIQVLGNLVDNALKFTPTGGRVLVKAFESAGELVTEVVDTGIGIRRDDLHKLFQDFKQLDMSATRAFGGSGLGLSLAKGIVEAHGGRIGVRSEPGVGSIFWFTLPEHPAKA